MKVVVSSKQIAMHGLILAGLLCAALLITNLSVFDETVHPDVVRLTQPGEPTSLTGNAVVGLLGLPAASDRDAFAVGREMIGRYRDKYQKGESVYLSEDEYATLFGETGLDRDWQADYPAASCTSRTELGCFGKLLAEMDRLPLSNNRLLEMLVRYRNIRQQDHFAEIRSQDLSSQQPAFGLYMQLSKLNLVDAYLTQGAAGFLAELEREDRFWRMMLKEGDSLLAKMVAVSGLWTNLQFLNEYLNRHTPDHAQMAAVEELLRPLTTEQLDIAESFASELRYLFPGTQLPGMNVESWPARWFVAATLQEHATINAFYVNVTQPLMKLSRVNARDFQRESGRFGQANERGIFPPSLYNLGGRFWSSPLNYAGAPNYIGRMHDLNGMFSLLRIRLETLQSGAASVESLLGESRHRNPYTGQAMAYDPQSRLLGFACFSRSSCQIVL